MKKIIFIIIIFLFSLKGVKALESKLEFIDNAYYSIFINDNIGNYSSYDNQAYIRINNNMVYCLEPDKVVYSNLNYNEGISNLNQEKLNQILLIGHYGYDYFNHSSYRYYMASQELIWQIVRPKIEVLWFSNNLGLDLSEEKNKILYLVNNHLTKPYFDNQTFNIKENEELILEDNILLLYDVISNNESSVRIEGNKLIINKRGINNEEILLKKKIKYDELKTKYYVSNNYQTLLLPRLEDEVISKIHLETNYGSIAISRVDSESGLTYTYQDASLNGSIYQLYDSNRILINEFIYNDNYIINNLPFGTYYLKEIEASKGYIKDNTTYTIKVDNYNRNASIILKINPIKAKFIIHNFYGDLRLKGDSKFMIYDMEVLVKDGLGEIVLKYGKYPVKQISTIDNHVLVDEFEIEVRDTSDIEYTVINEEVKASLFIYTVSNYGYVIEDDFTYKLFDVDSNSYVKVNDSEFLTTHNGRLIIENISFGNYILEQVNCPLLYQLSNELININIDRIDYGVSVRNSEFNGYININVVDELSNKINTSKVELYCKNDLYLNESLICLKDALLYALDITDGYISITNLIKGEYYIKQVSIEDAFMINNNIFNINIALEKDITIQNRLKPIVLENEPVVEEIKTPIKEPTIETKPIVDDILLDQEYIKIPNTGMKVFKINGLFALIIIFMGYIVIRYAKE